MRVIKTVIPFKSDNPKSRLASVLTDEERKIFAVLSLENVLSALKEAGISKVDILSKSILEDEDERCLMSASNTDFEIRIIVNESDLNTAVNSYLKSAGNPVLIVMADLALLKKENIEAMTAPVRQKSGSNISHPNISYSSVSHSNDPNFVRIAPGKDGGTNMMFISAPDVFEVSYYGESFIKHKEEAKRKNLICEIHESFYAAADMDEPEDLNDILRHGSGKILEFTGEVLNNKK
ncbi:MAG: 2-phospho-L-lactate guanylyltransferase [Methanosarcinales archaeon]|jgi:2-phospho-L-lactate guanylyltransferase|nr:2-phospho-L-lactate guanylyltransferase [Methanosarcinales archaeon]